MEQCENGCSYETSKDHLELANLLLKNGAQVNVQDENGQTPLHDSAFSCHEDMVKLLVENGAETKIKNDEGKTAKDLAGFEGLLNGISSLKCENIFTFLE